MIKIRDDSLPKIELARIPSLDFGVSAESPDYFQKQYTMISDHSYINPFLKNNQLSLLKIKSKNKQAKSIVQSKQWTSRPHLSNFSQMKSENGFLTGRKEANIIAPGLNHSMQFDCPFETMANLSSVSKCFNKKKGEFTTYLQNHLANIDFSGPILGFERSPERTEKTKDKLHKKKEDALEMTKQKYNLMKPNHSLSPLLEKTKIHRSRLRLNEKVHNQYKEKENIREKSREFELPKINKSELEESLMEMSKHYKKYKNDKLTKNFFASCLSSVKTVQFDKSGLMDKKISKIR